jgi:hypothetical protein
MSWLAALAAGEFHAASKFPVFVFPHFFLALFDDTRHERDSLRSRWLIGFASRGEAG